MKNEILRKVHNCELEILDEIVRICNKHEIKYYLCFGTLLGAVRHQGFIPWDDDIDIVMPWEDYLRFEKVVTDELKSKFFYQNEKTDPTWCRLYSKVRMNNTAYEEEKYSITGRHQGIYVDIWPLYVGKKSIPFIMKIRSRIVKAITGQIVMVKGEIPINKQHELINRFIPLRFFYFLRNKWNKNKGDYYINYAGIYGIDKEIFLISDFEPATELDFEGKKYSVPNNYKNILTHLYGNNYMQLPPVEKRRFHPPKRVSFDLNGPDEVIN